MASMGVSASSSNYSDDLEAYIFQSTITMLETIRSKVVLSVYLFILLTSLIQTFWKNKHIDRLFAYMNAAYSDGKFESIQISFNHQTMTCYRYDQRYSHIPHPNRSILLVYVTHLQVLSLIVIKTLFVQRNEPVIDCLSFHYPYEVLQCQDKRDPCQLNDTGSVPICTYYYFQMTNIITMVTSVVTWHYALQYFVIKIVRLIRWALFRNNDRPRRVCCCLRPTARLIQFIICFQYVTLWLYLFLMALLGFVLNVTLDSLRVPILGSAWIPIITAVDRLCSLSLAVAPELLQNWLDATANGEILEVLEQKELLLAEVEPLVYLIKKKTEFSTSSETKISENNTEVVVVESTSYI